MFNPALLFAISLAGQTGKDLNPQVTVADVVRLSLAHSNFVNQAQSQAKAARGRASIQSSRLNPKVEFNGNASKFDARTTVSFGGGAPVETLPDHLETLGLELRQILDFSGNVSASIAQARLNQMASEYDAKRVENIEVLNTEADYFELLRQRQELLVAKADLESQKQSLSIAKKRFDVGTGQKVDVLRAGSQAADAERRVEEASNGERIARSKLNDRMGRPLDSPLEPTDEVTPVVATDEKASAQPVQAPRSDDAARKALIDVALDHRPEILVAKMQAEAQLKGIKVASTSTSPLVSLSLGGNYYPTFSFSTPRQSTGTLALNVSVPLYDGGESAARRDEAKNNYAVAKSNLDEVQRQVSLDVQQASLNVESTLARINSASIAVSQAVEARRLAQLRYDNEVGLYVEVTDTQAALVAARRSFVEATYDHLLAKARLQYALGSPLTPLK